MNVFLRITNVEKYRWPSLWSSYRYNIGFELLRARKSHAYKLEIGN